MCNCTNSGCLKKYCECWVNEKICDLNCKCINCNNKPNNIKRIEALKKYKPKVFDSCACVRSKCLKKYCECFALGKKCKEECKCLDCYNKSDELLNNNSSGFNTPVRNKSNKRKSYEVRTPLTRKTKTKRIKYSYFDFKEGNDEVSKDNHNEEFDLFKYIDNSLLEYIKINRNIYNINFDK